MDEEDHSTDDEDSADADTDDEEDDYEDEEGEGEGEELMVLGDSTSDYQYAGSMDDISCEAPSADSETVSQESGTALSSGIQPLEPSDSDTGDTGDDIDTGDTGESKECDIADMPSSAPSEQ